MKNHVSELEEIFENLTYKDIPSLISAIKEKQEKVLEVLNRKTIPKHFVGLNEDLALIRMLSYSILSNIMDIGFYHGYKSNNPIEYNNALFTFVRLDTEKVKLLDSGTDHCKYLTHLIDHFACGEFETAKKLITTKLGRSKKGHIYSTCMTNLLQAILHNDEELLTKALLESDIFLKNKNTQFENSTVSFLRFLILKEYDNINEYLKLSIKGYKSNKWIHDFKDPMLKLIGNFPIGLYKIAKRFLNENSLNIELPEHIVIWKEFAGLNKKADPYIIFEGTLSGLNKYIK